MLTSKEKSDSKRLPMMPIRDVVIFPYMMTPFVVGRESSVRALEEAMAGDKKIFLATQHDASIDEPKPNEIYSVAASSTSCRASNCRTATSRFWWRAWNAPR
jgi:ATP-dependent Lon protease